MVEVQKNVEGWFGKVQADVTKKVGTFVAFLFFLIAAGVLIGITAVQHFPEQAMLAVLLLAIAGLVAYFNRTFALIVFILMLIFVFIL